MSHFDLQLQVHQGRVHTWTTELKKQVLPRFCRPGVNTLALGKEEAIIVSEAAPLVFFETAAEAATTHIKTESMLAILFSHTHTYTTNVNTH